LPVLWVKWNWIDGIVAHLKLNWWWNWIDGIVAYIKWNWWYGEIELTVLWLICGLYGIELTVLWLIWNWIDGIALIWNWIDDIVAYIKIKLMVLWLIWKLNWQYCGSYKIELTVLWLIWKLNWRYYALYENWDIINHFRRVIYLDSAHVGSVLVASITAPWSMS
jgi:hypothetical protein